MLPNFPFYEDFNLLKNLFEDFMRKISYLSLLTLPVPCPDKEKKLTQIFIFTLFCGASKGFMNAWNAFIKPFETPRKNLKIEILVNFHFEYNFLKCTEGRKEIDFL